MQPSLHFFWFPKSYKNDKSCKKDCKSTVRSFLGLKKNLKFFFAIHIYIYISIYISIYKSIYLNISISLYISIYIYWRKKTRVGYAFFSKECNVLRSFVFFCKRTLHSLCSLQKNVAFFAFFYVLCVLLRS